MFRRAVALLTVGAALAPASAFAARTLSSSMASDMAFAQAIKDEKATANTPGSHWLAPEIRCSRRASTWVTCHNTIGEIHAGKVGRICKRTVDVRLRSGRPAPTLTKRPMTCAG
jgi:hypothetical protein